MEQRKGEPFGIRHCMGQERSVLFHCVFLLATIQDLHHGRIQMKTLTNKWYEEVRQGPSGSEDDDEQELL